MVLMRSYPSWCSARSVRVVLLLCLLVMPALGQQRTAAEKAAAETLFDRGLEQLKATELNAACISFEQSQRIDPAVGTLLYLAECYERTGRIASAWATFREAASLAKELRQTDRAALGEERARRLEAVLSHVTFDVGENRDIVGFRLTQDDVAVSPALFGVPTPIDAGTHQFVAEAPWHETYTEQFSVGPPGSSVTVTIPRLIASPPASAQTIPLAARPPLVAAPRSEPVAPAFGAEEQVQSKTFAHLPSLILAGAGLAATGVAIGFGIHAAALDAEAQKDCVDDRCRTKAAQALSDDAQRAAVTANIGYGVGAAALITSAVLFFIVEPPGQTAPSSARFGLNASASGGGISYQGDF